MSRRKASSSPSLLTGIVLLLFGAAVWGLGSVLNNGITILVGVLFFVGGLLVFFGSITRYLDKL